MRGDELLLNTIDDFSIACRRTDAFTTDTKQRARPGIIALTTSE